MQTTRLVSRRFYQWPVKVAIFKEIFVIKCEKDLDCELFYSELNVTTSFHIIFTI